MALKVTFSEAAAEVVNDLRRRAERSPKSGLEKYWRILAEVFTRWLPMPEVALDLGHRLRGDLAGVYRIKKGRHRIFYIASQEHGEVIVLYLGYRKKGDKHDAYTDFTRRLQRGDFSALFARLGIKRPD